MKHNCTQFCCARIFTYANSRKVTDLYDAERIERQRKDFQRLDVPPEYSSKICSWKNGKITVDKNPEIKPQIYEKNKPSGSLLFDKCQIKKTELENNITLPSI